MELFRAMAHLAYIGSKYSSLDAIDQVLEEHIAPDARSKLTVVDLFSGTGVVGAHMNRRYGCRVVANDTEAFSACIARALLQCPFTAELQRHIHKMNEIAPNETGPLVREFAVERKFFTLANAARLQAARDYVDTCSCGDVEKEFLLASIITSVDRVANTAAVYASYLKDFKKAALKPLVIEPIHADAAIPARHHNEVRCQDANTVELGGDMSNTLVFLDPPYVARQYSAYYSPLGVIHSNDTSNLKGIGAVVPGRYSSPYATKTHALRAFKQLVERIAAQGVRYIFVTYGAYGIIPYGDMCAIMRASYPCTRVYDIANRKFKSDASQDSEGPVTENWFWGDGSPPSP